MVYLTRELLFTTSLRDSPLQKSILRPAIRNAVVSVGILFLILKCAAAATPPALEQDDLFAPYAKGVPKVTTVISEETKDGVKVTKLRFSSAEGSKEGDVKDCEIYAIMARPANTAGKKLPGMLVCHGGGGMANEGGQPRGWDGPASKPFRETMASSPAPSLSRSARSTGMGESHSL